MKLKSHLMAGVLLSLAGSGALVQSARAQGFTDTSRDLILTFREAGAPAVLEVDLGQASTYYNVAAGSSVPVTAYSPSAQLIGLFGSVDGLSWSVGGCVPVTGDNGDSSKPPRTLWVTDPRLNPATPATAWVRGSIYNQGPTAGKVTSILNEALTWADSVAADSVTNTPTAVAIPYASGDNANEYLGGLGNYLGTFQGDVENTTPADLDSGGGPSRSDLYEIQPGSGSGTYLGYFELAADGSMTFYGPSTVVSYPAPTLSITADGAGHVFIAFTSTVGGVYTLHAASAAGLASPVSTWPVVGSTINGDGTVKSFEQSATGTGTFYSVSVQ